MRLPFPAPMGGMNFALPNIGKPLQYASSIINGICRDGGIVSRGGFGIVTGTDDQSLITTGRNSWLHAYTNGATKQIISVTDESEIFKLYPAVLQIHASLGAITESNAVMFDGVLQYSLYPAAAPRTWDGYSDAVLSITRPATGDWSDPTEKVTNGDFAVGTGWTLGAGWAIAAGVATATASSDSLAQAMTLSPGRSYTVTFTVSGYTAGTVTPRFTGGTTVTGTSRSANGTYTETITAHSGGNTGFDIRGAALSCNIDNVSVKIQGNLVDADVTGFCVHKSRVWYWSRKSDEACYTALLARGGTLTRFPLGYVAETGGNIVLIETLTMDGGNGPDDFLAFILDTGEALIYQGSDPASANDWALVGRFRVPPPLNGKCVTRIGGDSLMLTAAGLIPLQNYIKAAFGQTNVDWLEKINPRIRALAPTDGRLFYSSANGLLFVQCLSYLFVMDVKSGGWSSFVFSITGIVDSTTESPLAINDESYAVFMGGVEIGNDLYVLALESIDGLSYRDALTQYETGSGVAVFITYGPQFVDSGAKSSHVRPYLETSGAGSFGVYLGSNNETPLLQFSVSYSGQTPFYSYAAAGLGATMQMAVVVSISTTPATEGLVKYVAVDLMAEGAQFP